MDDQPNIEIENDNNNTVRPQIEKTPERYPFLRVRGVPFRNDIPVEVDYTRTNSYLTHNYMMTKSYMVHCEPYLVRFDLIPTAQHQEVKSYCKKQQRAVSLLSLNEEHHLEAQAARDNPENRFFNTEWRNATYLGKAQQLGMAALSWTCFTLVTCAAAYGACYLAYKLCAAVYYVAPAVVAVIEIPEKYLIKLGGSVFQHLSRGAENGI